MGPGRKGRGQGWNEGATGERKGPEREGGDHGGRKGQRVFGGKQKAMKLFVIKRLEIEMSGGEC